MILADDPTGNLDTATGNLGLDLSTSRCREAGAALLMATHAPLAAQRADRVAHGGRGAGARGSCPVKTVARAFLRELLRHRVHAALPVLGVACGIAAAVGMSLSPRAALASFERAVVFLQGAATHTIQRPAGPLEDTLLPALTRDPAVRALATVLDRRLRLAGLLASPTGDPLAVMDIGQAQRFLGAAGVVDRVDLVLDDAAGFRRRRGVGFLVQSGRERALTMAAMLRSLGAGRGEIATAFCLEILLLGVAGGALGGALGYLLTRLLMGTVGGTINTLYFFLRPSPPAWSRWIPAAGAVLGCVAGLLGALVPLVTLARTVPVQLLGRRAPGRGSGSSSRGAAARASFPSRRSSTTTRRNTA